MIWSHRCNSGVFVSNILTFNFSNMKNAVVTGNKPSASRCWFLCLKSTKTHLRTCVISQLILVQYTGALVIKRGEGNGRKGQGTGPQQCWRQIYATAHSYMTRCIKLVISLCLQLRDISHDCHSMKSPPLHGSVPFTVKGSLDICTQACHSWLTDPAKFNGMTEQIDETLKWQLAHST